MGNCTEINFCNADSVLEWKYTYRYDDRGNWAEINTCNSDSSLNSKFTYKYDDRNNMTEKNYYRSDGSLLRNYIYKYKYDSKGNWIERIEYYGEANIKNEITEREIKYYK
jgi:hypothetical protein